MADEQEETGAVIDTPADLAPEVTQAPPPEPPAEPPPPEPTVEEKLTRLTKAELVSRVIELTGKIPGPDKLVVNRFPFYKLLQAMVQNQLGQSHMGHAAIAKFRDIMGYGSFAEAQAEWDKIRPLL